MKTLTCKEIAQLAGVSASTVSRVLTAAAGVNEEKRQRILDVLDKTGTLGKFRSGRKERTLGLLLLPEALADAYTVCRKLAVLMEKLPRRWKLVLLSESVSGAELISRHLHGELDGLLIMGYSDHGIFDDALRKIPHVWLNSRRNNNEATVLMGNEFSGRIAARHLLDAGCLKGWYLDVFCANPGVGARLDGFRFAFFAGRKMCDGISVLQKEFSRPMETVSDDALEDAIAEATAEIEFGETDGLFIPEDRCTALFFRVRQKLNKPVCRHVVSCNSTPAYLAGLVPRPTTIDLAPDRVAELGLEELLRRIAGATAPHADDIAVVVMPHYVAGDTVS